MQFSRYMADPLPAPVIPGSLLRVRAPAVTPDGDGEIRTLDPLLARQVLSQLSYAPMHRFCAFNGLKWTRTTDLTLIRRAL